MFVGMELGICIGACIADGEWKDRCMAWGFEYDECSEVWGEAERSMVGSGLTKDRWWCASV